WSVDEGRAAAVARDGHQRARGRIQAIEEVAYALMTFDHVRRTRHLAAALARELPVSGLTTASRLLAAAAERVAREVEAARATAAALLVAYVEELHHIHKVT